MKAEYKERLIGLATYLLEESPSHDHGWMDAPEGGHIVCPGDWILTGVKGERYPCKPDIFEARQLQSMALWLASPLSGVKICCFVSPDLHIVTAAGKPPPPDCPISRSRFQMHLRQISYEQVEGCQRDS